MIYFTIDGQTDPRLLGGGINPAAAVQSYLNPITLNGDATIRARFRTAAGAWSPLVEMSFTTYLAGEYTGDQVVDGADFLAWQRSYGSTANPVGSGADGSYDGAVDGADLAVWQNNFGAFLAAPVAESFQTPALAASLLADEDVDSPPPAAPLDAAFATLAGWPAEQTSPRPFGDLATRRPALDEVAWERWQPTPSDHAAQTLPAGQWASAKPASNTRFHRSASHATLGEEFAGLDAVLSALLAE